MAYNDNLTWDKLAIELGEKAIFVSVEPESNLPTLTIDISAVAGKQIRELENASVILFVARLLEACYSAQEKLNQIFDEGVPKLNSFSQKAMGNVVDDSIDIQRNFRYKLKVSSATEIFGAGT